MYGMFLLITECNAATFAATNKMSKGEILAVNGSHVKCKCKPSCRKQLYWLSESLFLTSNVLLHLIAIRFSIIITECYKHISVWSLFCLHCWINVGTFHISINLILNYISWFYKHEFFSYATFSSSALSRFRLSDLVRYTGWIELIFNLSHDVSFFKLSANHTLPTS